MFEWVVYIYESTQPVHRNDTVWRHIAPKNIALTIDSDASIVDFEDARPLTSNGELRDWKQLRHMFEELDSSASTKQISTWAQLDVLMKQKFPPEFKRVSTMSLKELGQKCR